MNTQRKCAGRASESPQKNTIRSLPTSCRTLVRNYFLFHCEWPRPHDKSFFSLCDNPTPARAEGASLLRIFNKDLTRVLLSVFLITWKKKCRETFFWHFFFIFFTYGSCFSRILFSETSRTVWIFHVDFFFNFNVLAVNFHAHKNEFFHARLFIFTHRISDQ